jgi:uncharacterized RDD family membrane protein YckC
MKCPECGYVSFDDLKSCKKCGTSFEVHGGGDSGETGENRLRDEIFSLRLDDDEGGEDHLPAEETQPLFHEESEEEETGGPGDGSDGGTAPTPGAAKFEVLGAEEPVPLQAEEEEPGEFGLPGVVDEQEEPPLTSGAEEEEDSEEKLILPNLEIDFDPVADEVREEQVTAFSGDGSEPGTPPRDPVPVLEDDNLFQENLWVQEGAGFLPRFLAFAVDSLIIAGVLSLFFGAAMVVLGGDGGSLARIRTAEGFSALFVPFYLLGLFLSLSYFTFFMGWIGRTPGKALLQLDVRRTDGGRMTYTRAFLRWVGYLVSVTFAGLGFLWIFFDERKRGWHDYLSGTWVKNLRHD